MTPHYLGLNALSAKYGSQGFVILGFPCNIFLHQEPGATAEQILNGIKYVNPGNNFVPNFQMFWKVDVNGDNEHPLYTYVKSQCPNTQTKWIPEYLFYSPFKPSDIIWNFETFLIGWDGKVIKRAPPPVEPKDLSADIEMALAEAKAHGAQGPTVG